MVKHPDREVQTRLKLIFDSLLEKRSIAQVVRFLVEEDLKIPRRDGFGDIQWNRPTASRIATIVKNPAYAGAFTYGRTRSVRDENTSKIRLKHLPMEEWKICIRDKYPAYISWEAFEKINAMLRDNYNEYVREGRVVFLEKGKRCCRASCGAANADTRCLCSTRAVRTTVAIVCESNIANACVNGYQLIPLMNKC